MVPPDGAGALRRIPSGGAPPPAPPPGGPPPGASPYRGIAPGGGAALLVRDVQAEVSELRQVGAPDRLIVEPRPEVRKFRPVRRWHLRRPGTGRGELQGHGREPGDVQRGHGGRGQRRPGGSEAVPLQYHGWAVTEYP